jgi:hypothetical protein
MPRKQPRVGVFCCVGFARLGPLLSRVFDSIVAPFPGSLYLTCKADFYQAIQVPGAPWSARPEQPPGGPNQRSLTGLGPRSVLERLAELFLELGGERRLVDVTLVWPERCQDELGRPLAADQDER